MALSIAHRASGVALAAGLLLLAWWLLALAAGPRAFALVEAAKDTPLGVLVLLGYSFVLFFHLCNGVRHLVWDAGFGFEPATARQSGVIVLAAAAALTLVTWLAVLLAG